VKAREAAQRQLGTECIKVLCWECRNNVVTFVSTLIGLKASETQLQCWTSESTRLIGEAQKESYKKYGIKYVKWIAEASACDFCEDIAHGGKDGEGVYKLDKVPAYPQHPNCQCSLAAYYEWEK